MLSARNCAPWERSKISDIVDTYLSLKGIHHQKGPMLELFAERHLSLFSELAEGLPLERSIFKNIVRNYNWHKLSIKYMLFYDNKVVSSFLFCFSLLNKEIFPSFFLLLKMELFPFSFFRSMKTKAFIWIRKKLLFPYSTL